MKELNPNQFYEIKIEKLVYGGDGLARLSDGRAIFVPCVIPGEVVKIRITEERQHHVRGEVVDIVQASPMRTQSQCKHFSICGGCSYQHIPYELQLDYKMDIVKDQLQRIGRIENPPIQKMVPSPCFWRYRNVAQFHLAENGKPGFQVRSSHKVIPIEECYLLKEEIAELWPLLEVEADSGLEKIEICVGSDGDGLVILKGAAETAPEFGVDLPISAVYQPQNSSPVLLAGDNYVLMEVLDRAFQVSSGSFFQVNTAQAVQLVQHLVKSLPLSKENIVLDLYCGVGLFSAFIAPYVKQCIGIESAASSVVDFAVNLDDYDNVVLYEGMVEDILPRLDLKADIVVLDPPRSGLNPRVMDAIAQILPGFIAYVSCDPATLARDLKRLIAAGYTLSSITPFDMFPQTYHVESVALLKR